MSKKYQISLMVGAVKDYQGGLMPLGILVGKVEGILDVIEDRAIRDSFFDALLAVEEVYARIQNGSFDSQQHGKPVVDHALKEMLTKAEAILATSV